MTQTKTTEWFTVVVDPVGAGIDFTYKFYHYPTKDDIIDALVEERKASKAARNSDLFNQAIELVGHLGTADSQGRIKLCYVDVGQVKITRESVTARDNSK